MADVIAVLRTTLLSETPTPSPSASLDLLDGDDLKKGTQRAFDWLLDAPLKILIIVVVGAITLWVLRRLIRSVTNHLAEGTPFYEKGVLRPLGQSEVGAALSRANPLATARRAQRARTLGTVLRSVATIAVGTIGLLLVLDQLGVNLAPFVASAGIVGVALGIGAQSVVRDFLAGIFILLEDQYGVGDVVDLGPATGTIEAVALRVTKLRDANGTLWYVPNGTLTRVGNKTQVWARAVVEVKVDYFADLDHARALLMQAATEVASDSVVGHYLREEPVVTGIEDLSAEAVTLQVSVKTDPAMQWEVARQLRVAVRRRLEEAGIPLGGQRDLLAQHRAEASAGTTSPDGTATSADGPTAPSQS